jgi:hypothetical protein
MRLFLLLSVLVSTAFAAVPAELEAALKEFRAEPPPGWSYTLTSEGDGQSMVEHCDAAKPEFDRWTLVQKNGKPPTADEARDYRELRTRRSRGGTAPRLVDQLDLATLETAGSDGEHATFRCRLRPGDGGDNVAGFLRATISVNRSTHAIETIELASTGEFSPSVVVKIAEMNTRLTYHRPADGRPALPRQVFTRVRGRAFLFKSLDAEMTVTFSDYVWAGKKPATEGATK